MADSEIVITPSRAQYRQLCEDLERLRAAGAESNTAAILEAVNRRARETASKPVSAEKTPA